ncbi:hypothetical protein Ddc_18498 [Ditylenchus destructor]|nr:hypothetical protein Ddc_18498 [Ditylenchus destructor]
MSSIPYILMLFTCVLLLVPYMCLLTWATYPREVQIGANYTEVIELLGMNVDPAKFRVGLMITTDSVPWALTSCYIVTLETISYTIIIVCGLKLQKFVRESIRQNRPRMMEVNHQLNRVLDSIPNYGTMCQSFMLPHIDIVGRWSKCLRCGFRSFALSLDPVVKPADNHFGGEAI